MAGRGAGCNKQAASLFTVHTGTSLDRAARDSLYATMCGPFQDHSLPLVGVFLVKKWGISHMRRAHAPARPETRVCCWRKERFKKTLHPWWSAGRVRRAAWRWSLCRELLAQISR